MKRIIAIVLAAIIAVSSMAVNVFAADPTYQNRPFTIYMPDYGVWANYYQPAQLKKNESSIYVNYTDEAYGVTQFIAYVYAGLYESGPLYDVSSVSSSGTLRPTAYVTLGTKGYIRSLAVEQYGRNCYVQLMGSPSGWFGEAHGLWSPDSSAESGTVYYN